MHHNVLIIGYGASGQAACLLAEKIGHIVWVYDDDKDFKHPAKVDLHVISNKHFDFAILSPGISSHHHVMQLLKEKNVTIIGEAEFALSMLPQRKIAVTGTNGKTTVTYLCEHILKVAGFDAIACGNVAKEKALSTVVLQASLKAVLVVELSSFQLETLHGPHFESGVVLNITPDHLDRYDTMTSYAMAKLHLINLCDECFVYEDIEKSYALIMHGMYTCFNSNDVLRDMEFELHIDRVNACSAYFLLKHFQIPDSIFIKALKTFKKPRHRLEKVAAISGIEFINDSKATNIDATIQALKSFKKPCYLLAGGVDKGYPYTDWLSHCANVKGIICFGAAKELIFDQLSQYISCVKKQTLAEALVYAYDQAKNGDTILLSPGCSSFDEFKDYQQRGFEFCQNVLNLKPKEILI